MNIVSSGTHQRLSLSVKLRIYLSVLFCISLSWSGSALAANVSVNCNTGGDIQTQLNLGNNVDFSGICREDIFVPFNGQYIKGGGTVVGGTNGGIIQGFISVYGRGGVLLEGFRVLNRTTPTASNGAVFIINGGNAKVKNVSFENLNDGFCIARNSFAEIDGLISTTQTNTTNDSCTNVSVFSNSGAKIINSTITNDTDSNGIGAPVYATRDSYIGLRGGNRIQNNGTDAALSISQGSHAREDIGSASGENVIIGAAIGFEVWHDSSYDMRQSAVTGPDNYVGFDSSLRIGTSSGWGGDPSLITVVGDITASHNSTMSINSGVEIIGTVSCESFSTLDTVSFGGEPGSADCPYEIKVQGFSILNHDGLEDFSLDDAGNAYLAGTFNPASSRKLKTRIEKVDSVDVLNRIMEVPITKWSYKRDAGLMRHIGPMSEDFYAAFELGRDDKTISTTDASGIALAAIQGLKTEKDRELAKKDLEIAELNDELTRLSALIDKLTSENLLLLPTQ